MNAPISMLQVIQGGVAPVQRDLPRACPFCGTDVGLAVRRAGAFYVGCLNDDCGTVQFAGATPEEAMSRWNKRARMAWEYNGVPLTPDQIAKIIDAAIQAGWFVLVCVALAVWVFRKR